MDSSQVFGGEEECNSSESGWTMYIGSPVQTEEENYDTGLNAHAHDIAYVEFDDLAEEYDTNSDDSMVSDASSGPSHRKKPWEIKKGAKVDGKNYSSANCKAQKGVKKNRHEKKSNVNKDEAEVVAKEAKCLVKGSKIMRKRN